MRKERGNTRCFIPSPGTIVGLRVELKITGGFYPAASMKRGFAW